MQLSFIPAEPAPIARASDPYTSHLAAAETTPRLNALQAAFVDALAEIGPATAAEAARHCAERFGNLAESYRKRANECVRAGAVQELPPRRCSVSGKMATVYRARAV